MYQENAKTIAIDVDLTLVRSDFEWANWLDKITGEPVNRIDMLHNGQIDYDLTRYYPKMRELGISPFDFWEDPFLYDKMAPILGAVEAVKKMKDAGFNIRFVSYCKNGHFSSKARWLKRHFPFVILGKGSTGDGFYATHEKGGVMCDMIIDDRHEHLNQFSDRILKVKYWTPYTQSHELRGKADLMSDNWSEIADFAVDILK